MSALVSAPPVPSHNNGSPLTYVDFRILKPLLQIVVDRLIRDLADQGKIRDSHFLLLCTLENSLFDLGLPPSAPARRGLGATGVLLAAGALRNRLEISNVNYRTRWTSIYVNGIP